MPLFNDLKKIFFGAKSIAKHQAERGREVADEAGRELADQGGELLDLTKAAALNLAAKAPAYIAKGKEALSDLGDAVYKATHDTTTPTPNSSQDALEKIDEDITFGKLNLSQEKDAPKSGSIDFEEDLQRAETAISKEPTALGKAANATLDSAARAGNAAKDAASRVGDQLLDRAATAGARLKGKTDDFIDHANREAEKMKLEESILKAKAAAEQAEARARVFDGKEATKDDESTLSGTDSFFDRADRFARGDYHNEGGKDMRVQDDPNYKPRKKSDLIAGFDDTDGDGDSLIDDAIIEEE